MTTAYGGNLRAFLLHPDATPAVESIGAIVRSGLPWKVVLYGGLDESWFWFYRNEDSDIGRYWREKEGVAFKDMPFEEVADNTKGAKKISCNELPIDQGCPRGQVSLC